MDMYSKKNAKKCQKNFGYPEIASIFASWMRGKDLWESKTIISIMTQTTRVGWDNYILFGGSDTGELCHKKEKLIIYKNI